MIGAVIAAVLLVAESAAAPAHSVWADLEGSWVVDLSVANDAPYTQPMILKIAEDKVVTGEFYNSAIEAGRAGRNQGRRCVSFTTSDGAGPYHHAACLIEGQMVGQSWAEHRKLLLPWTAKRAPAP